MTIPVITIDAITGRVVSDERSGVIGQISFTRLARLLKTAGEIMPEETITHLRIMPTEGVIQYIVTRDEAP